MEEKFVLLINKIKESKSNSALSEEATKQGIILPILSELGWNVFDTDEVYPEFNVANKRVDYSLRHKSQNKVFLEVKKTSENLDDHQEQILNYSFHQGVELAILSNGITWSFYLPLKSGDWTERRFYSIDIDSQEIESIINKFNDFLRKDNIISSKAIEHAESILSNKKKGKIVRDSIPKAWNKLLEEKDDLLIDLISETTESICGLKPSDEQVKIFLDNYFNYEYNRTDDPRKKKDKTQKKKKFIKLIQRRRFYL